jgi:integrase
MKLSDLKIRNVKATDKPQKLSDGLGMYLHVSTAGRKTFRMKYQFEGKEKLLTFGPYPLIGLQEARAKRDDAKRLLLDAKDPGVQKAEAMALELANTVNTFENIANAWMKTMYLEKDDPANRWCDNYYAKVIANFKNNSFPFIGHKPIDSVTVQDVLAIMQKICDRKSYDTSRRTRGFISQVYNYFAIPRGLVQLDPAPSSLDRSFPKPPVIHRASINDPALVGELLRSIDAHRGTITVFHALKLAPLLFVRPGELRQAEWSQFDLESRVWYLPAPLMKMKRPFIVPLSDQALAILLDQRQISFKDGKGKYVFPADRGTGRCMSDAAVNAALKRLGWDTQKEITGHGFRSMARTMLDERKSVRPEVIEVQLAHSSKKSHNGAYDRTEFIEERVEMMQVWSDYLDELKAGKAQPSLTGKSFDMRAYQ